MILKPSCSKNTLVVADICSEGFCNWIFEKYTFGIFQEETFDFLCFFNRYIAFWQFWTFMMLLLRSSGLQLVSLGTMTPWESRTL